MSAPNIINPATASGLPPAGVFGTGTIGTITKFSGTTTIANSVLSENNTGTGLLLGTNIGSRTFTNTKFVITQVSGGANEPQAVGIFAEARGTSTGDSAGVYGHGWTYPGLVAGGLVAGITGEGRASGSTDVSSAIGVRGYSNDTHAGGSNIALYGNATNGATNYALYMNAGNIFSNVAQTWTLAADTSALNIQSGLLNLDTTNSRVSIGTATSDNRFNVYTTSANGIDGLRVFGGTTTSNIRIRPAMAVGANNNIVAAGDSGIIFDAGFVDTGAFVIAPWASSTSGLRMTSSGNVGIGTASPTAGRSLTTAADCDIFGLRIGRGLLPEANSTALGASALNATVVGALNNTAVGSNAGKLLTTGVANTFAGYQSGFGTTTGGQNTYFGYSIATGSTSTGSRNTAIGGAALASISSGSDNVIVGYVAAAALTTGTNNIIIGASANTSGAAVTNEIVIGASATGAGSNTTTIGTTATTSTVIPGGSLTVAGSVSRTSGSTAGVANLAYIVVAVPQVSKAFLLSSTTTNNEQLSSLHLVGSDSATTAVTALYTFQTTVATNGAGSIRITNMSGGTVTVKWSLLQIS